MGRFSVDVESIAIPSASPDVDVLLRVVRAATLLSHETRTVVSVGIFTAVKGLIELQCRPRAAWTGHS